MLFSTSTQRKFWIFPSIDEVRNLRNEANSEFINKIGIKQLSEEEARYLLTPHQEYKLSLAYEYEIKKFCMSFPTPLPSFVIATSMIYFKRFFLHNSIMEYNPEDIMITCIFLACKVEEYYVSIQNFSSYCKLMPKEACEKIVRDNELLVMLKLHYHLTIYKPYKAVDGFLLDIRTRCKDVKFNFERVQKIALEFIDRSLHTDVFLLYSPSQIALAAVLHSVHREGHNLDEYVLTILLHDVPQETMTKVIEQIKKLRKLVKHQEKINRNEIADIEARLRAFKATTTWRSRNSQFDGDSQDSETCMD
ncbi:DgyrCDS3725 [Dimorphilus gyrociliatus]|uniref:Cyclin-H n=1 Tax=Dimorphilus gyrociliatus TaxID=2664684 RepID=A0A7I8VJD3_9ANNE|nr:DgyrCDS3725 [Dimorphilus gyrociliatus]